MTIRIRSETKESLEDRADEYGISVSEHVRQLIDKGREYDKMTERLESRRKRIDDLEEQLARRQQIEAKIEDLPDQIRGAVTYQERRQRLLDQASLTDRLKWKVTGVPVDELVDDD